MEYRQIVALIDAIINGLDEKEVNALYEVIIKREKTLLISATPESNRADVYTYRNNDLTGFSTIRVKVIAENGLTNIYSIDIQKAAYNKKIEIIASVAGVSALLIVSLVIYLKKKNNKRKEYLEG